MWQNRIFPLNSLKTVKSKIECLLNVRPYIAVNHHVIFFDQE